MSAHPYISYEVAVRVVPSAPRWFVDSVKAITLKLRYELAVNQSDMRHEIQLHKAPCGEQHSLERIHKSFHLRYAQGPANARAIAEHDTT